jgi:hypothetical protein
MWTHVGEWALPFHGKVEYVPELKLWFDMSANDGQLAAANLSTILSTIDSQLQLVGAWKELEPPLVSGWMEMQKPQLASLGSGNFFSRSFLTRFVLRKKGKPPSEDKLTADLTTGVLLKLHLRQMRLVDQACSAPKRKMI